MVLHFYHLILAGVLAVVVPSAAWCGDVTFEAASRVAHGQIAQHMAVFGSWHGAATPAIVSHETIAKKGHTVAYHFRVQPSGYVIVAAADEVSPVPFYSTRSTFDLNRGNNLKTLESWILFRLTNKFEAIRRFRIRAADAAAGSGSIKNSGRVRNAWRYFNRLSAARDAGISLKAASTNVAGDSETIIRGAIVAPLLTTIWGQVSPYNSQTPDDGCSSGHTLTGCVATAWAQTLRYWQWPPQSVGGQGTNTYTWEGATVTENLTLDFSNSEAYDWGNMPDDLSVSGTTQEQIEAVSMLMYYMAVAANMDFGCPESATGSASGVWADEVLSEHFRFKSLTEAYNRRYLADYSAAEWFSMIKAELDADPARPVIFSMGSPAGWHEVVIDGYQEGVTDKVHINFGWEGGSDAYYDITDDDDFNTGSFDWDVVDQQVMVIGIEPDNNPPVVQAGDDLNVEEEAVVTLSVANVSDPEGVGISSYLWTQISGPVAVIADATTPTPTITTSNVDEESQLVFQVRVTDLNRAWATDTCTVTVSNTDGSVAPPVPSSGGGGGGGGGCFIDSLFPETQF